MMVIDSEKSQLMANETMGKKTMKRMEKELNKLVESMCGTYPERCTLSPLLTFSQMGLKNNKCCLTFLQDTI